MMKGLENLGATCWLNALVQCLRVCPLSPTKNDMFNSLVITKDTDNTTDFLNNVLYKFGNVPSDAQEALVFLIDKFDMRDFIGEETHTLIFPEGKTVNKHEFTIWFNSNKSDVVCDYVAENGKKYNVAMIQREMTKVPKVLVSDVVKDEMFGKKLVGIVCWGWGHYVAYVKNKDGSSLDKDGSSLDSDSWFYANDEHIRKVDTVPSSAYISFYV
jgi:hypothetical protein